MIDYAILIAAAFIAGILNTIAGGGSFLTFPALVYVGIPPVVANATSAVAVFPGYLGGALGFREEIMNINRVRLYKMCGVTLIGGVVGSVLLIVSSDKVFNSIVPWLLLFATLLFAMSERIILWAKQREKDITPPEIISLLLVSIYGGYFNGGLGIVLLALFSLIGMTNLNQMNGLKNGLSFVISAISVFIFVIAGLIVWPEALIMMVFASIGGYMGAGIAKSLPKKFVQFFIVIVGLVMSLTFYITS